MLRLRVVAGVRRPPTLHSLPLSVQGIRTLFQTRTLAAASAAQTRMPASRNHNQVVRRRGAGPSHSRNPPASRRKELPGPTHSEKHILAAYPSVGVEEKHLKSPKDALTTFTRKLTNHSPGYITEQGYLEGREHWR